MSPSQPNQMQIEAVGFILGEMKILSSCGNQIFLVTYSTWPGHQSIQLKNWEVFSSPPGHPLP